ncbi:MAG: HsdR family type I site-specific deoxyribonuclease [Anaerolineae bacterium]|nr:HsdR family type I site-specific deoxyribonuclease [Anaerolineae bacterium]
MKQKPTESNKVELPLMHQLRAMGWDIQIDDSKDEDHKWIPSATHRDNFSDVLLKEYLKAALYKNNVADDGTPWLDDERINIAITALERVSRPKLMEANIAATQLLLEGVAVPGDPVLHGGKQTTIHYIDYSTQANNSFLAINQFRVDPFGTVKAKNHYIPDIVLFVNGIPLVVIECKAPGITEPMVSAIKQLLQYSNQRGTAEPEGIEKLFWYNQAMVATYYYMAKVSTIGASYEHYVEWKSTAPYPEQKVLDEVQTSPLVSQQRLVGGILRPLSLLDLIRHFTLFKNEEGRIIKVVARYQQWEAVHEAIRRLRTYPTRLKDGEFDRRGGIIWHTQGSGKSLTMVFLVRKLRTEKDLRQFKVVVVTDRRDLEDQLSETMKLTGEAIQVAGNRGHLARLLSDNAPGLIFGMIQKYRRETVDERTEPVTGDEEDLKRPIEAADRYKSLNESTNILVLVDEAHRSHTDEWHANMMAALPNSARIGFTGTPIMMGAQKKTADIFGDAFSIYNIRQAEEDEVIVPILYEGREVEAGVLDHSDLDQLFETNFNHLTPEQQQAIKDKYAREQDVLESVGLINKKAEDILKHYISTVLPNGFKAQLVAVTRRAAVRYQEALANAHRELLEKLQRMDIGLASIPDDKIREYDEESQYLIGALKQLDTIKRLEFAAVISSDQHDDPSYRQWTLPANIDSRIERFKKPLNHADPGRQDGLAILCIRTMLLTGFDAKVEQALYLDRFMQGHELLQAIARVNRTYKGKSCGYVVDYYGVTRHLVDALAVYSKSDVEGSLKSIVDTLPRLQDRHKHVLDFFRAHDIQDIFDDMDACVMFLVEHDREHAEFSILLKNFLVSLDIILPRPQALPYVDDAKQLGVISRSVTNMLREEDDQAIAGVGEKVRQLIDDHIEAYYVEQSIPPLSITDANFAAHVNELPSDHAKAAEMEHAARHEINVNYEDDPVYYEKLSERLQAILEEFGDHWDELVAALQNFVTNIQAGPPSDHTSAFLPQSDIYRLKPFMTLLIDSAGLDAGKLTNELLQRFAGFTVEVVALIREQITRKDFWATQDLRQQLEAKLKIYLDEHDVVTYEKLDFTVDRIVELAKRRHTDLTNA